MGRVTDGGPAVTRGLRRHAWVPVAGALAGALGWAGAGTRPFTAGSNVLVFGLAGAVAVAALVQWRHPGWLPDALRRHPVPGPEAGTARAAWPWWVLGALVVAVELVEFVQLPRRLYPTISSLAEPAFLHPGFRGVAVAAWVLFGIWMLRR